MQPPPGQTVVSAEARRKLDFLREPASFPGRTDTVEIVETHFAWIFLTRRHAWKMKKPIRAQVVDYRSLADREYFCREELRLNRRLASWVYLDVVPLGSDGRGGLRIGSPDAICDWLVKMCRLPRDHMLDRIIARDSLEEGHLELIAERLAHFHDSLQPEAVDGAGYRDRLHRQLTRQERQLQRLEDAMDPGDWDPIIGAQARFIEEHGDILAERAEGGCIVEAHGDLRPEHICLDERFAIIDCLEFSRDLRIQDRAEEIAFLALECERAADRRLGETLMATYARRSGDQPPTELMAFYLSRRATVRAILSAWHVEDPSFDRDHYLAETGHYRRMAARYIRETAV